MTNFFRAELMKLTSGRSLLVSGTAIALFAAVMCAVVILYAPDQAPGPNSRVPDIRALSSAGGATAAFATGASFVGVFALVLFTANIAGEFSQNTVRTMLIRQPGRLRFIAGKMGGLFTFVALSLAVAAVLTVAGSYLLAPVNDIATGDWISVEGLKDAAQDYGIALFVAGAWLSFAMALAVGFRSVPLALGIGVAWFGPIEHITADVGSLERWYPGLMLESLAAGGTDAVSMTRAFLLTGVYVSIAIAAGATLMMRRDVTG